MWAQSSCISAGDVVILWLTREDVQSIVVTPGKELNGRYGVYRHADLVGVPYGSKLSSRNGRGFIHVLRPTPELWTLALPHRTQILYHADISYIAMWLAIKPGSVVIEAVFLDLPAPWEAVASAGNALRKDRIGRICCFSPCMEQVLRTVSALNELGFTVTPLENALGVKPLVPNSGGLKLLLTLSGHLGTGVTTHETLLRPHDVCNTPMQTVGEVAARLRNVEVRKEERRRKQIETSNRDKKRKRPEETSEDQLEDVAKKAKKEGLSVGEPEAQNGNPPLAPVPEPDLSGGVDDAKSSTKDALKSKRTPHHPNAIIPVNSSAERYIVSKPFSEIRGHTSYLTFAILAPSSPRSGVAPEGTTANESSSADGLQNSNPAVYDAQSIDETTAAFDSLIDGIPEEELERMLNPEL
ncbi:tRNA (adenine-N(1)-)-methyltransferase catalytic subunit trm61 [Ceratobasidium sp. 395]|nr:tRNA (adenine-N(1)-)-methyltransferase catalytic subunit trm61 [Ceratobasidium sp. 395]